MKRATRKISLPTAGAAAAITAAIAVPLLVFGGTTATAADNRLEPFRSCDDFVRAARQSALETMTAQQKGGGIATTGALEDSAVSRAAAPGASQAAAFSTTNVQVAGVDEPDIVKSDGARVFAIAKGRVYAIDAAADTPRVAGSLALPDGVFAQELLLSGNRLVVIGTTGGGIEPAVDVAPGIAPPIGGDGTTFVDLDVSDPANLRIRETLKVDGGYQSARMVGATARVVLTSQPLARIGMSATNEADVRAAIDATNVDSWVPHYTIADAQGTVRAKGAAVQCSSISRPTRSSGLGMMNLLTLDLSQGITPVDSDAVMAQANTVMASADRVYVALGRGEQQGNRWVESTDVHVFDATSPTTTDYRGSGSVDGVLINQFAMSEWEGKLRVATTITQPIVVGDVTTGGGSDGVAPGTPGSGDVAPAAPDDARATAAPKLSVAPQEPATESAVTVLELQGDRLNPIGRVAGLGKGERIYAVRYIGPTGYVVTFRQTDPLYTVDLSNPTAPRVAGELKIPGYSAYLHPVDERTLIGVGQNADANGRVQGLQVGLFDVADPAKPKRTQVYTMPAASSEAEYDHHAFLWWPATRTVVLPLNSGMVAFDSAGGGRYVPSGPAAIALRVTAEGIAPSGTIKAPGEGYDPIRRSLVIGQHLVTISDSGAQFSTLDGATSTAWLPFT